MKTMFFAEEGIISPYQALEDLLFGDVIRVKDLEWNEVSISPKEGKYELECSNCKESIWLADPVDAIESAIYHLSCHPVF